jgi:hypothetical protein
MPPTTYLHIRPRGDGPARVLALSGDSARVGRGAECEVRLDGGSVATVQCELRRSGDSWEVRPVGPRGRVAVDGIPVDRSRAWPAGSTLRVADFHLTWHAAAAETFEDESTPVVPDAIEPATAGVEAPTGGDPTSGPEVEGPAAAPAEAERLARWQASLERRERWLQARKEEARWERRWRAAGERLRARSGAGRAATEPLRPPVAEHARPTPPPDPPRARRPAPPPSPLDEPTPPASPPPGDDDRPRLGSVTQVEPGSPAPPPGPPPAVRLTPLLDPDHLAARLAWEGSTAEAPIDVEFAPGPAAEPEPEPAPAPMVAPPPPEPEPEAPRARWAPPPPPASLPPAKAPSPPPKIDRLIEEASWPSVRSILEAQRQAAAGPARAPSPSRRRGGRLTEVRGPSEWAWPAPLAAPPALALLLVLGGLGLALAWRWGQDDRVASAIGDAILAGRPIPPAGLGGEGPPGASWWGSTADHLMLHAAAVGATDDPTRRERAEFLVGLAANAAPAHAGARAALAEEAARFGRPGPPPSRDAVALGIAARRQLAGDRPEEALALAREALALAADADPAEASPPVLLDDSGVKRSTLPNEDLFAPILGDLARRPGWTFDDWSGVLPDSALAWLAAYRVLRASGAAEADEVLARIVARPEPEPDTAAGAVELAARAEALAFLSRWDEAEAAYRAAIPKAPDEPCRSAWWLNLAEIYNRMYEPARAREARAAAWGVEVESLRPDPEEPAAGDPDADPASP